jgi:molecular chaperone GrpE
LELAWRTRAKTLPTDAAVRDALARWYEPATLGLLEDSPANCLLVTWSAPADAAVEAEQQQLVKVYAEAAHKRGLAVLGLVYAAGDASKIAADAARAALDGLVLEGEFAPEFPAALHKAAGSMLVIEIAKDAAPWRWKPAPIVAVAGVAPSARNLSEMGIRGAPSSEPWIKSNTWLVRSFGLASPSRPVWISDQIENASAVEYARTVADAAAAGGRWIVSLDDALRAKLRARDASALEAWRRLSSYLKFAESHAAWRDLAPYGNVGMVLDPASTKQDLADEYLNLAQRVKADFENYKRRNQSVREDAYADGVRDTLEKFLPVLDNLERAVCAEGPENALRDGVQLVLRQLCTVLASSGVEEIPAQDCAFDPNVHHAVMQEPAEGCESGKVIGVLQKGYTHSGKVLRHSMVKVSE